MLAGGIAGLKFAQCTSVHFLQSGGKIFQARGLGKVPTNYLPRAVKQTVDCLERHAVLIPGRDSTKMNLAPSLNLKSRTESLDSSLVVKAKPAKPTI